MALEWNIVLTLLHVWYMAYEIYFWYSYNVYKKCVKSNIFYDYRGVSFLTWVNHEYERGTSIWSQHKSLCDLYYIVEETATTV